MLTKSYISTITTVGIAALVLALLVMRVTTPLGIGPLGVTVWFMLVLVGVSAVLAAAAYGIALKLQPKIKSSRRRLVDASRRGLMLGGYLTILLALASLRQLNARDAILLILLLTLIEFYTVARS